MIKFYTNSFSPFARKVALALDYKNIPYQPIDGLNLSNHAELHAVNSRGEVPALMDHDIVVVNSADILSYLDHAYPKKPIYAPCPKLRAEERGLERLFDTFVDAILVDCSLWSWTKREDTPMDGLFEKAQHDLNGVFDIVEKHFQKNKSNFGETGQPGVLEFALWPHLTAVKPLGLNLDSKQYPAICEWIKKLRQTSLFQQDLTRTKSFLQEMTADSHETTKVFWRGDRIEWLLSKGYHEWFLQEIKNDRVLWPNQPI